MKTDEVLNKLETAFDAFSAGECGTVSLSFEEQPLSLMLLKGLQAGPTVWIEAALHGDECDGVLALFRLKDILTSSLKSGRVILCPVTNPTAFQAARNASPLDNKNLNRMGKDETDTYSARYFRWLAALIAGSSDAFVDLHGGGACLDVLSFALFPGGSDEARQSAAALCEGLELDCLAEAPDRGEMITAMKKAGLKAVLLENGGGSAVSEECVRRHFRNTLRILKNLRMLDGIGAGDAAGSKTTPLLIRREFDYYFEEPGIVTAKTPVGTQLKKGDLIYTVTDPVTFENHDFRCPLDKAILLSVHNTARAVKGAYAAYLGTED